MEVKPLICLRVQTLGGQFSCNMPVVKLEDYEKAIARKTNIQRAGIPESSQLGDGGSKRPIVDVRRIQQLIEDVYSDGWYTQAEEFQKLLDAYKELLTESQIGLDTLGM
jgi:hypothetical protein